MILAVSHIQELISFYCLLLHKGILSLLGEIESSDRWNSYLFPFCGDQSSLVAINTRSGKVVEWDEDDGSGDVLAESFSEYLEEYRNALLEGKYEYIDDVGAVEKVTKPRK